MYSPAFWARAREPNNQLTRTSEPPAWPMGKAAYKPCGDRMELYLDLAPPSEDGTAPQIREARFLAKGCAPVVAVADLGCSMLAGLTPAEACQVSAMEMDQIIGPLPLSKRHAYLLFLECLSGALDQHKTNQIAKEKP